MRRDQQNATSMSGSQRSLRASPWQLSSRTPDSQSMQPSIESNSLPFRSSCNVVPSWCSSSLGGDIVGTFYEYLIRSLYIRLVPGIMLNSTMAFHVSLSCGDDDCDTTNTRSKKCRFALGFRLGWRYLFLQEWATRKEPAVRKDRQ